MALYRLVESSTIDNVIELEADNEEEARKAYEEGEGVIVDINETPMVIVSVNVAVDG